VTHKEYKTKTPSHITTENTKCCYGNKDGRQQPRMECQYWLHNSTETMAESQLTIESIHIPSAFFSKLFRFKSQVHLSRDKECTWKVTLPCL